MQTQTLKKLILKKLEVTDAAMWLEYSRSDLKHYQLINQYKQHHTFIFTFTTFLSG